ncbi:hypothetical protein [Aeoliella sp. SH292]|uniref:hypothetical protein n=1 Tax=Aeoliella sp. SH292 TaxID=3454464 RepID=UPI003F986169
MRWIISFSILMVVANLFAYFVVLGVGFSMGIARTPFERFMKSCYPMADTLLGPQYYAMAHWPMKVDYTWWIPAIVVIVLEATLLSLPFLLLEWRKPPKQTEE